MKNFIIKIVYNNLFYSFLGSVLLASFIFLLTSGCIDFKFRIFLLALTGALSILCDFIISLRRFSARALRKYPIFYLAFTDRFLWGISLGYLIVIPFTIFFRNSRFSIMLLISIAFLIAIIFVFADIFSNFCKEHFKKLFYNTKGLDMNTELSEIFDVLTKK